jgi:hypothetical protein
MDPAGPEIAQLVAAYGDAISRRAWDEVVDLFVPGCPIRLDLRSDAPIELRGGDELVTFVARAMERFDFFVFVVLNSTAESTPDGAASGRLWFQEIRRERADQRWTTTYGLYRDTYAPDDGRWRFATRSYTTLGRADLGGDPGEVFDVPDT